FRGGQLRVHGDRTPGNRIHRILAHGLIKSVREIEATNVTAAQPSQIADTNSVCNRTCAGVLIDDVADRCGAHQKTVVVVMDWRVILIPGGDEFRSVTRKKEVLQIHVAEQDLLMAALEAVQAAVGIFLEKLKIRSVVLDPIGVQIAEDANRGLFVYEKK